MRESRLMQTRMIGSQSQPRGDRDRRLDVAGPPRPARCPPQERTAHEVHLGPVHRAHTPTPRSTRSWSSWTRDWPASTADLTLVFSSMHHADELGRISAAFLEQGRTRHVLGCTGESIVGEDREVEGSPALAVWSITLPGRDDPSRSGSDEPGESRHRRGREDLRRPRAMPCCSCWATRSRSGPTSSSSRSTARSRGLRVVGGMASGSQVPRANQLVLDGEAFPRRGRGACCSAARSSVADRRQPGLPADRPHDDRDQGRAEHHPRAGPPPRARGPPRHVPGALPPTTSGGSRTACTSAG